MLLQLWLERNGDDATYEALIKAMLSAKKKKLGLMKYILAFCCRYDIGIFCLMLIACMRAPLINTHAQ